MSERDRNRMATQRAEKFGWKKRPPSTTQASRTMGEQLRQMNEEASVLDRRLSRHGRQSESWHEKWDESPRRG